MYVHYIHANIWILTEIHLIHKQRQAAPIKKLWPKNAGHKDNTKIKTKYQKNMFTISFFLILAIQLTWLTTV